MVRPTCRAVAEAVKKIGVTEQTYSLGSAAHLQLRSFRGTDSQFQADSAHFIICGRCGTGLAGFFQ